jgi:glycosyltransferase involved in cell wall biosynthesis
MSSLPATSILLPARDAERTLSASLESLAVQTDPDFELLLVDDGSRDGTAEIARRAAAHDGRIRIFSGPGRGIVSALELARGQARGRYLLRMDADDIAHPRRLELTRAVLESDRGIACVSSLVESFDETAAIGLGRRQYDAWLNAHVSHDAMARVRFVESPVAHPSVLLRAEAVASVGGYRDDPGPEDWDLWLRLFEAGYRFEKVPRILLRWRESPGRLTRTDARYEKSGLVSVRARHLARGPLARRGAILCGAGKGGGALAQALVAEGVRVKAFIDVARRRVGGRKAGIPVFAWSDLRYVRDDEVVLGAAGGRGARASLRATLLAIGLKEGSEFYLAA